MTKQRLLQHLQRTAGSCRAVAFDVFDTLLYRDVAAPADLFALMERTGRARPWVSSRPESAAPPRRQPISSKQGSTADRCSLQTPVTVTSPPGAAVQLR